MQWVVDSIRATLECLCQTLQFEDEIHHKTSKIDAPDVEANGVKKFMNDVEPFAQASGALVGHYSMVNSSSPFPLFTVTLHPHIRHGRRRTCERLSGTYAPRRRERARRTNVPKSRCHDHHEPSQEPQSGRRSAVRRYVKQYHHHCDCVGTTSSLEPYHSKYEF